jgi:hypothetical protein
MSLYLLINLDGVFEEILLIAEHVTHEQPGDTKQPLYFYQTLQTIRVYHCGLFHPSRRIEKHLEGFAFWGKFREG